MYYVLSFKILQWARAGGTVPQKSCSRISG